MTSARLLAVAFFSCFALTVTQGQQPNQHQSAPLRLEEAVSDYNADGGSRVTPPDANSDQAMVIWPYAQDFSGSLCYTIRSYVVARDSKDSDSTHFVRSSTCQPASRYRVRTIEARPDSSGR